MTASTVISFLPCFNRDVISAEKGRYPLSCRQQILPLTATSVLRLTAPKCSKMRLPTQSAGRVKFLAYCSSSPTGRGKIQQRAGSPRRKAHEYCRERGHPYGNFFLLRSDSTFRSNRAILPAPSAAADKHPRGLQAGKALSW